MTIQMGEFIVTRIPAIFRDGKFVPVTEVHLQDETAVELLLLEADCQLPHPDRTVREAARRRAVASMRQRTLPLNIPSFTRDELHERR